MTLAVTKVKCEKSFSPLKMIKSWLRSMFGHDRLEAFVLLKKEQRILDETLNDEVIEKFSNKSTELSN